MQQTPNLNLNKPDGTDVVDIADLNANMDIIDGKLGTTGHDHSGTAGNGPKITSSGLAAGAATDTIIGSRTATDSTAPTSLTGSITTLLNGIFYMLKSITGKANSYTAPATTLEAAKNHMDTTASIHGSTNVNTANRIVQRDASGNFAAGTISGSLAGNSATATKLATARTITLTGDVTGSGSFDGSSNLSISTTNTAAMPVGFTFPLLANSPLPGSLALQGALVSRTAYPDLWAWVQANAPLITESAWQAQAAVQTSVGAYSSGDGSTSFRLPKIVDFVRGSDTSRTPGTWQADALQGHGHKVYMTTAGSAVGNTLPVPNGDTAGVRDGAITRAGITTDVYAMEEIDNGYGTPRIDTETRPKSISMLWCVKAFGAATNQGVVDITALAASLNDKIGKSDSGYHTKVWLSGEYTPVANTPTIVTHGLSIDPAKCKYDIIIKCVAAENGYSVGDYAINAVGYQSNAQYSLTAALSSTTIQINTGTGGLAMYNKASGVPVVANLANWRYIFRVWY